MKYNLENVRWRITYDLHYWIYSTIFSNDIRVLDVDKLQIKYRFKHLNFF